MRSLTITVLLLVLRWLGVILLLVLAVAAWDYGHDRAPSGAPMGEQVTREEEFLTAQIINAAIDTSVQERTDLIDNSRQPGFKPPSSTQTDPGYSPYQYRRDAHAKGHGCVLASFTVNKELDARFSYGIFANPGHTYDAIIRYSNGNPKVQSDSLSDPHGMAIKLFNVPGPKLMPLQESGTTQDFILMDNPVFFIRTIEEYAEFNHLLATGHPFKYFMNGPNILRWHLHELRLGLGAAKSRPDSLVTTRYFSASAYALGPTQYVKYSAIPCASPNKPMKLDDKARADPDYLRLELAKQSEQGGACFDFAVQPQVLGKNMPVEDTTVEWKESDSPFVPVAHIVIQSKQNNTEPMNGQCENTAFNPWHSLADHRPAGVMNRVRNALYQAMSRFRQTKNCAGNCDRECNSEKLPDSACAP